MNLQSFISNIVYQMVGTALWTMTVQLLPLYIIEQPRTFLVEEDSNIFIFFVSTISLFFKKLITQNLKFKSQNKTVEYNLHHLSIHM